jgi:Methyltransferase domain
MEKYKIIHEAIKKLFSKIKLLNPVKLNISDSNRIYLIKYINNYSFYMYLYSQLLLKALKKLNKPVSESSFIDYGGGCGILSYLAKEIGFKTVVYNDIDKDSAIDTQTISRSLGISIDYYICGDIKELIDEINLYNIKPDLICSFDVLEHIYDLELWIKSVANIKSEFLLLFMTSANPGNPLIANRLKKLHIRTEYIGYKKNIKSGDKYLSTSFLEERKRIIRNKFPDLENTEINLLSLKSRGLRKDDIEKVVHEYIKTGEICYKMEHPTNTCDPYTGSWTEKLIDLKQLKIFIAKNNLIVNISNSLYGYSNNKILNTLKFLLNQLIRASGSENLFFSPTYTLEIQKHPDTKN